MIHLNPYTGPLLITAGATLLALGATLACTVLALRLGKVSRERDRLHLRFLHERRQRVEERNATRLIIAAPPRRPSVHFGNAELGAMVQARAIRLESTPAREG